MFILFI